MTLADESDVNTNFDFNPAQAGAANFRWLVCEIVKTWPPEAKFAKRSFTDAMLSITRLASNVSKIFPLCFYDIFYPMQNIFCHNKKDMTVVINFDILLTQHLSTLARHYSKTITDIRFRFPVFNFGSRGTTLKKKKFCVCHLVFKMAATQF